MSNLTVFFDGSCPLCQREIGFYRSRKGAEAITWVDVSAPASPLHGDLSCEAAMRRFHIRDRDGNLLDGAAAFAALWRAMPGFRWLGAIVGRQPMLWVAERVYDGFLVIRPAIQTVTRRLASPRKA